jgi:hypothetical protein
MFTRMMRKLKKLKKVIAHRFRPVKEEPSGSGTDQLEDSRKEDNT